MMASMTGSDKRKKFKKDKAASIMDIMADDKQSPTNSQ